MRRALALVLLIAACGGPTTTAATTPSPSQPSARASALTPAPTPTAGTAAYGVLAAVDPTSPQFTISIVGVDGRVVASAKGTYTPPTCPAAGSVLHGPPISTTNDRVFYVDGTVKWLTPSGGTGTSPASTDAGTNLTGLSASPDDSHLAIEWTDFARAPTLGQAIAVDGKQIFSTTTSNTGTNVVGWHAGNLVLAYYPQVCTQGGGPGVGLPRSYHVSSAIDAHRIATIGSDSGNCFFGGVPGPAGVVCSDFSSTSATMFDWSGASVHLIPADPQTYAFAVSPDGARVAMCCAAGQGIRVVGVAGAPTVTTNVQRVTFGWIDATHILIGAEGAQDQALVWDIAANKQTPVAAQGDFRGRIPGTLDLGRGTGTGL